MVWPWHSWDLAHTTRSTWASRLGPTYHPLLKPFHNAVWPGREPLFVPIFVPWKKQQTNSRPAESKSRRISGSLPFLHPSLPSMTHPLPLLFRPSKLRVETHRSFIQNLNLLQIFSSVKSPDVSRSEVKRPRMILLRKQPCAIVGSSSTLNANPQITSNPTALLQPRLPKHHKNV
jgi:hypothetical protein